MMLKEVLGNEEAKDELLKWTLDWQRGKKGKPILLTGAVGGGKTALVNALVEETSWNKVELFKEDVGDEKKMNSIISAGKNLWGVESFFVMEDVDSSFSKSDLTKVKKVLESCEHPLILTAAELWSQNLGEIRNYCLKVELKKINSRSMKNFLDKYADEKKLDKELVPQILEANGGDLRSALIDLENNSFASRDRTEDVFKELLKVFKHGFAEAMEVDRNTDLDMLIRWVEENIPAEYEDPQEIADAYQWLSRAFVFKARMMNRQYYTLMRYIQPIALGGVASAKKQKYSKFSRYQFPMIIRKLGQSKKNRELLKSAGLKMGLKTHLGSKAAVEDARMLGMTEEQASYYGLSEDEAGLFPSSAVQVLEGKKAAKRQKKS